MISWCIYLTRVDTSPDLRVSGSGCQDVAHSHHSFLGTLAVGDSRVALQLLDADLLTDHIKAAGDGDGNGVWKTFCEE